MLQWHKLLIFSPEMPISRVWCFYFCFCAENSCYLAGEISIHLSSQMLNPLVLKELIHW